MPEIGQIDTACSKNRADGYRIDRQNALPCINLTVLRLWMYQSATFLAGNVLFDPYASFSLAFARALLESPLR